MTVKVSIANNVASVECGRYCVLGAFGRLDKPLAYIEKLYEGGKLYAGKKVDFARFMTHEADDALGLFHFYPPVDMRIERTAAIEPLASTSSIIAYSLDKNVSWDLVNELIRKIEFRLDEPPRSFIESERHAIDANSIEDCDVIKQAGTIFDDVFGARRYASFLSRYKGVPVEKAMRDGNEKFGLPEV